MLDVSQVVVVFIDVVIIVDKLKRIRYLLYSSANKTNLWTDTTWF